MREILFRGKSVNNEEWFFGDLLTHEDVTRDSVEIRDYVKRQQAPVTPDTVGQFTGLVDKNGKKIFEGDIVMGDYFVLSNPNQKKSYGIVGYGAFNCSCCDGVYGWHFGEEDIREYKGYVVVGNIYDNPELLEGTK